MLGSSETGRTYLAEMSKYIIPIAKEFDGKLFMPSDYMEELVVNVNYFENKYLRKGFAKAKEITELNIVGGGLWLNPHMKKSRLRFVITTMHGHL